MPDNSAQTQTPPGNQAPPSTQTAPQPAPATPVNVPEKPVKPSPKQIRNQVKILERRHNLYKTQELITQLEGVLNSKVICYYIEGGGSISQTHPDLFLDHLMQDQTHQKVSLVVVSYGGASVASYRIASIIREYYKELDIIVPARCVSAATVLALSGDKIIMTPSGYLSAIDSSVNHALNPQGPNRKPIYVSVDQVKRVLQFLNEEGPVQTDGGNKQEGSYRTLFKYLHPLALGEIDRYSSASEQIAVRMMKMHPQSFQNEDQIKQIAKHLVNDYPLHAYPILFNEAKEIGLPVEKAGPQLSALLRQLVKHYDITSMPITTYMSPTYYHSGGYPYIIESRGLRTTYRISDFKRLNQTTKYWQTEKDSCQWVNMLPSNDPTKPPIINPLDTASAVESEAQAPQVKKEVGKMHEVTTP